jgi:hypothetical protein
METNEKYGLDPQYPIMLRSVGESHNYMMSLLCSDGFNIVFHRLGSKSGIHAKPMDTYEVMTADCKRRVIYVYCYAAESHWRSPMGFLFDPLATFGYKVEQSSRFLDDIHEGAEGFYLGKFLSQNIGAFGRVSNFPTFLIEQAIEDGQCEDFRSDGIYEKLLKA